MMAVYRCCASQQAIIANGSPRSTRRENKGKFSAQKVRDRRNCRSERMDSLSEKKDGASRLQH